MSVLVCSSLSLLMLTLLHLSIAQPSLVSFSLVLTPPEILSLTFDAAPPEPYCDVSKLTFQNSSMIITSSSYQPQEGNCSYDVFPTTLIVNLSSSDWAAIQANTHLATEVASTYLSIKTGFISQGSNSPISSVAAIQVTSSLFIPNNNPPMVDEAQLDLDSGILILTLYEGSQYSASDIISFSDAIGFGGVISLTNYTTPNNVDFYFFLPIFLTNSLKMASPPFTLLLPAGLFSDSSGTTNPEQQNVPIVVIPDVTPPSISSFSFDLDEGSLVVIFNEPINAGDINITTGLYLTGSFQGSSKSIDILAGSISVENQDTDLIILLTSDTLDMIKFDTNVCTSNANCWLGVNSSLLSDTAGNVISTSFSNIIADVLTIDTTSPQLISYTLDLESSSVLLTFDEPIDNTSVNTFDLVFDLDQNNLVTSGGDIIEYEPVSLGGASSTSVANTYNTELLLHIDTSTLIGLKILVSKANVTLTVAETTVVDTGGNEIVPILLSTFFPPSQIIADQSPPLLIDFIAGNPQSKSLRFVFSEPVELSSWNTSALTLTLISMGSSYGYEFIEGRVEGDETLNIVTFTISDSEFSQLQLYEDAYVRGKLEVTTTGFLVEDLFGNKLQQISQPIIFNATEAGMRPTLQSVDFDLDSGTLNLTFSDLVVVSYTAGRVHLQDDSIHPSHILSMSRNGTFTITTSLSSNVILTLAKEDINNIKVNPYLGSSAMNTFVVLSEDFAYGPGSLPLQIHNGTQVRGFTPDTTIPQITRFELDLDSDTLSIHFDEPVVTNTFDETRIVLLNSTNISSAARVFLSSTYPLVQGNVTLIRALIHTDDVINIKRQPLCYSVSNCYVRFDTALVTDVSNNVFMDTEGYAQVDLVSPDVSPPQLVAYPLFDLDSGHFTLIFSEPVNGSSTDYTLVEFHSAPTDSNTSVTLTEGYTSQDHITIDFFLSADDLNELKNRPNLCTEVENCWIRLPSFFVTDIGMNPFIHSDYESDVDASFHQPLVFITDRTAPTLLNATIDLNQGTLSLIFSEVIVPATFSPSDVTLLQGPSSSLKLTLSSASIFSLDSDNAIVSIALISNDLNWIKRNDIFTTPSNSYISLATGLVDVSGNQFQNITQSVGFEVRTITPDVIGPRLVAFNYFDLENNSFSLSFDEPMNVDSFNSSSVNLVSSTDQDATVYSLTGASSITAADNTLLNVAITLTAFDRVQIKLSAGIGTSRSNTYISLGSGVILDTSNNHNSPVAAIQLSTGGYGEDTSPAALIGFSLDLDSSSLSLTFNDVISVSSITMTSMTIQNSLTSPTASVTLTTTSITLSGNNDQIPIQLSAEDVFKLKSDLNLATSSDNTFISVEPSFAEDIEGRPLIAIPSTLSLPLNSPFSFTPDTTHPFLSTFSLDMDSGVIMLTFSEPITASTFDPSKLTLHGQRSPGGSTIILSPSADLLTSAVTSTTIDLQLTQSDTNYIKTATDLALDTETTFLSFSSELVTDVSGNSITSVTQSESIKATGYIIDSTPPELVGFEAHLAPIERLSLTFSESIVYQVDLATSITLLNSKDVVDVVINLSEDEETNQTSFNTVDILLSRLVISRLLTDTIASSVDTLYLSLSPGQITDTIGNQVIPVTTYRVQKIYRACFSNKYSDPILGVCLECSSVCSGGCSGPNTTISQGGCDSCDVLLLNQQGQQLSCSDTELCPLGFFSTSLSSISTSLPSSITEDNTILCQQCHSLCATCDGPTLSDCFACNYAFTTNATTGRLACLESCDQSTSSDCVMCHEQCRGCIGPTERDCVQCKEDTIQMSNDNVCIPECTDNTFLSLSNEDYTCEQCHSECIGCNRSNKNTDCTVCRNTNLTVNGTTSCLSQCPLAYYPMENSCMPCHEYCIGCIGPSSMNCTQCVEDEVDIGGGVTQCVPTCSYGREYDIMGRKCVLTSVVIDLSITAGVVGSVTIIPLIFLIPAVVIYHHKKKKDKMEVLFISSSPGHELTTLD